MRGSRVLLLVLALLILIGATVVILFLMRPPAEEAIPEAEDAPARAQEYIDIVVSAQNPVPRGWRFQTNDGAATLQQWPVELLPPAGYVSSLDQLVGMYTSVDIPQGAPILLNMLSDMPIAQFPAGRVAYTVLMDVQGGVAWWLKPGDHVDVLAAISLTGVDEEYQSPLPNQFLMLPTGQEEEMMQFLTGTYGRFETLPNNQPAIIFPSAAPIPNVVVQLIVQDAIVWHVGVWSSETEATPAPAAPEPQEAPLGGFGAQPPPAPQAVPLQVRRDVEPVTLVVTHQDALVLKYLQQIGADLDLAIRPAGDDSVALTQPVWLRYVLDRYQLPTTTSDLPVAPLPLREPLQLEPQVTPPPE